MGHPDGAVTGCLLLLNNLVQASSSGQDFCKAVEEEEDGEGNNENNEKDDDGSKDDVEQFMRLFEESFFLLPDLPNILFNPAGHWILLRLHV